MTYKIEIPGYKKLELNNILFDYNGTIALDGKLLDDFKNKLSELSKTFKIYVLTADTHGNARKELAGLDVEVCTFPSDKAAEEKLKILKKLGKDKCVTIGNGRNDLLMNKEAGLSICIIGEEGAFGRLVSESDLVVTSLLAALDLLLNPIRIVASLRG